MPKCGCTRKKQTNTKTKKQILHKWVKKGRQKGGFFPIIGAILAAISAGLSAAAPAVATGAIGAAAAYATTKALEGIGGKTGAGRRVHVRRTVHVRPFVKAFTNKKASLRTR
jgi:phage-related minor tail protein